MKALNALIAIVAILSLYFSGVVVDENLLASILLSAIGGLAIGWLYGYGLD